jgi:hypothetical protein
MHSTGTGTGNVTHRLADLEAVLTPLVPALEQLHAAQVEQRRLVVAGDLSAMVTINTAIQDTSARIALLEQRRQSIQAELEAELGVQGLRAVLTSPAVAPPDRARLGPVLVPITRLVRDLREQGRSNAALLDAAIGAASRTRQVLARLSGADNTYNPVKARRQHAAMRARASLATMTPHGQATMTPPTPEHGALSAAPDVRDLEVS